MEKKVYIILLLIYLYPIEFCLLWAQDNQAKVSVATNVTGYDSAFADAAAIDTLTELIRAARKNAVYRNAFLSPIDSRAHGDIAPSGKWQEFIFKVAEENLPIAEISFEIQNANGTSITTAVEWELKTNRTQNYTFDYDTAAKGISNTGAVVVEIDFRLIESVKILVNSSVDIPLKIAAISGKHTLLTAGYRIMPIGDSIIYGKFAADGIGTRKVVYDLMQSSGMSPAFVGYYGKKPYNGHFESGRKIEDYYPPKIGNGQGTGKLDVTEAMNQFRPQMVFVHLGTNDINSNPNIPMAPYFNGTARNFSTAHSGDMATFIDYLLNWHNGTRGTELEHIIVCTITPTEYHDSLIVKFNTEIGKLVRDFRNGTITGQPEPVTLCDQYSNFRGNPDLFTRKDQDWMYDWAHPNTAGHNKMGEIFFRVIKQLLQPSPLYFTNVAWDRETTGTNHWFGNNGVALADLNQDGIDDIYVGIRDDINAKAPNFYFESHDSIFSESATLHQINDVEPTQGVVFVDLDNDGDFDLFIGHYQKMNRLYRNNGNGTFSDISSVAGIANLPRNTLAVLALDIENDGDMDLYAVNSRQQNELYVNNNNGTFTLSDRGANDIDEANVGSPGAAAVDVDLDGDTDIYITKRGGPNVLFINDGRGYFTNKASQYGLADADGSVAPVFVDYDNDGDPDLFIAVGHSTSSKKVKIFRNNGNGSFTNLTQNYNVECSGYNTALADFDNDGDVDLLSVSDLDYINYYENDGLGNFSLVAATVDGIWGGDARSAAVGDFNNDGAPDVYVTRNNMLNAQLENKMGRNANYLKVMVQGPQGNAGGFGTKLTLYQQGSGCYRDYLLSYREVTAGSGNQVQNSPLQHFGLGFADRVDLLAEFTNGVWRLDRGVRANQTIQIAPDDTQTKREPQFISYESGNNQSCSVGSTLPEPILVKVTDANGYPVAGVPVDFQVVNGSAEILWCDTTNNAMIWKEAESGTKTSGVKNVLDNQASSGQFVYIPETEAQNGQVTLDFVTTTPDDYYLWLRIGGRDQLETSIDIKLDNGIFERWNFTATSGWRWERVTTIGGSGWPKTILNGSHNLILNFPEGGPFIDKILLTLDANFTPTGIGYDAEAHPLYTDASGIACRRIRMGNTMGSVSVKATATFNGRMLTGSPVIFDNLAATSNVPYRLVKISDDSLRANGGEPLTKPYGVQCFDKFDNKVANASITFTSDAIDGSFSPKPPVSTNYEGIASITYILGTRDMVQTIMATVVGFPTVNQVTFTAFADDIAHHISYVSGDLQTGTVGELLPDSLKVRVNTATGASVVGYPIVFSIIGDSGFLEHNGKITVSDTIISRKNGIAAIRWQLSEIIGQDSVIVQANGLVNSPLLVTATAMAGAAAKLYKDRGDSLSAPVYKQTGQPIVVKVTDLYGNVVVNHEVKFIVSAGGGKISAQKNDAGLDSLIKSTGIDGRVSAWWTMGGQIGAWNNEVKVVSVLKGKLLQGSPLYFYARGTADVGVYLSVVGGDNQTGVVRQELTEPFCVRVEDRYHNPVPNFPISFIVTMGGGNFSGLDSKIVTTAEDGTAYATLTLGCPTISNSHQTKVTGFGLFPEYFLFTATGIAGSANQLKLISGANQVAKVNTQLPGPLTVKVTDACNNAIVGHPVNFTITRGNGHFVGTSEQKTDSNGLARITYVFGTQAGDSTNLVEAVAFSQNQPLLGAPIPFWQSGLPGDPHCISEIAGNHLVGIVNEALPESLGIEVKDVYGNLVPLVEVEFSLVVGTGNFIPASKRLTNKNGFARVNFIPLSSGNIVIHASVKNNGHEINGSPARIDIAVSNIIASRLVAIAGDNQLGIVGQYLNRPFQVHAMDAANRPAPNFGITFTIITGNGTLDNTNQRSIRKMTDSAGNASVILKLGTRSGSDNNIVHASAKAGELELSGSPIIFKASAESDLPDFQVSRIAAWSPVPANGSAASQIEVKIMDQYGNPIPGQEISFFSSGCSVAALQQPFYPTNADGITTGYVSSTAACIATVSAQIVNIGHLLTETARIAFIDTDADNIALSSGNIQSGNMGTHLPEPLCVIVKTLNGQPVQSYPVRFKIFSGGGSFRGDSLIYTNVSGRACVDFTIGYQPGLNLVHAEAYGLKGSPVEFSIMAKQSPIANIKNVSEIVLMDTVGTMLAQPFRVCLVDAKGEPVAGAAIQFNPVADSFYTVSPQAAITNSSGIAETYIRLGFIAGDYQLSVKAINDNIERHFPLTILPGRLNSIKIASGYNQTGIVNQKLQNPLIVKVVDRYDNGVPGLLIDYNIIEGNGQLIPNSVATTAEGGIASVDLILGKSIGTTLLGANLVRARARELPSKSVTFIEFAVADKPDTLVKLGSDLLEGRMNEPLSQPIQVKVNDQYGNPVQNTRLTCTVLTGGGKILEGTEIMTDKYGTGTAHWTLGAASFKQILEICVNNTHLLCSQFTAIDTTNAAPKFVFPVWDDTTISENEKIEFLVQASDPGDEPIRYDIQDLPNGATFVGQKFSWTPGFSQAKEYRITLLAEDRSGITGSKQVRIRVKNVNRKPFITSFTPPTMGLTIYVGRQNIFSVEAVDADNDPLSYRWYNNIGELLSVDKQFIFEPKTKKDIINTAILSVFVFDNEDTVSVSWSIAVTIQLKNFAAHDDSFNGVKVVWETDAGAGANIAGFNLKRSFRKEGPYRTISEFIRPNETGYYLFYDNNVGAGVSYYYMLEDIDLSGVTTDHDPILINFSIPKTLVLHQNFPNPFNPETNIRFEVPVTSEICMKVFNIRGEEVTTLARGIFEAGYHSFTWKTDTISGMPACSGVYYCVLESKDCRKIIKMVLLK